ncbi:hypothetical protein PF003_g36886 [Phytophthora fragariae]|nr:hypothetical protein PF003_g36886 [Phytophthora fragariae]
MGLLQLLTAVVVALIVFIDGIASTTNEISATESSVLQNKAPLLLVLHQRASWLAMKRREGGRVEVEVEGVHLERDGHIFILRSS